MTPHQAGLTAIGDEGLLGLRVEPPFHDVQRFLDHRPRRSRWSARRAGRRYCRCGRSSRLPLLSPGAGPKADLSETVDVLGSSTGSPRPTQSMIARDFALHVEVLDHEDVHLTGLGDGRHHIRSNREIVLHRLDRDIGVGQHPPLGFRVLGSHPRSSRHTARRRRSPAWSKSRSLCRPDRAIP